MNGFFKLEIGNTKKKIIIIRISKIKNRNEVLVKPKFHSILLLV